MSKAEPKIVAVHLIKPHRHAGRDYQPGTPDKPSVLKLREDKAEWLVNQHTAEYPPAEAAAPAKTPAPAPASPTTKTKE